MSLLITYRFFVDQLDNWTAGDWIVILCRFQLNASKNEQENCQYRGTTEHIADERSPDIQRSLCDARRGEVSMRA